MALQLTSNSLPCLPYNSVALSGTIETKKIYWVKISGCFTRDCFGLVHTSSWEGTSCLLHGCHLLCLSCSSSTRAHNMCEHGRLRYKQVVRVCKHDDRQTYLKAWNGEEELPNPFASIRDKDMLPEQIMYICICNVLLHLLIQFLFVN